MTDRRLTLLVHGDSGHGKSWLGDTAPGPRLLLDVEGRSDYTPSGKVLWNPREPIPAESDDPNMTTVVDVQDFGVVDLAYQWLASGQHPFNSVVVDSITELQQRKMDTIAGVQQPQTQHWGALLREMEAFVRRLRDLRKNPIKPLWAVVLIAGSQEKNGKQRAFLQGQLGVKIAYHMDVVGYLVRGQDPHTGEEVRQLHIKPFGQIEAKDNTHLLSQHYGAAIPDPNITAMLRVLNAEEAA